MAMLKEALANCGGLAPATTETTAGALRLPSLSAAMTVSRYSRSCCSGRPVVLKWPFFLSTSKRPSPPAETWETVIIVPFFHMSSWCIKYIKTSRAKVYKLWVWSCRKAFKISQWALSDLNYYADITFCLCVTSVNFIKQGSNLITWVLPIVTGDVDLDTSYWFQLRCTFGQGKWYSVDYGHDNWQNCWTGVLFSFPLYIKPSLQRVYTGVSLIRLWTVMV